MDKQSAFMISFSAFGIVFSSILYYLLRANLLLAFAVTFSILLILELRLWKLRKKAYQGQEKPKGKAKAAPEENDDKVVWLDSLEEKSDPRTDYLEDKPEIVDLEEPAKQQPQEKESKCWKCGKLESQWKDEDECQHESMKELRFSQLIDKLEEGMG